MKKNLPVTGVEQRFDAAAHTLSTSDIKEQKRHVLAEYLWPGRGK